MKKLLITLILLFGCCGVAIAERAQFLPDVVLTEPTAIWVDIRTYADDDDSKLYNAIEAIGSTQATLLISEDVTLEEATTVPANVTLKFTLGSVITLAGYNLTIVGNVPNPSQQIFNENGIGIVSFSGNTNNFDILPEWWGAIVDDSTDDTDYISSAVRSAITCNGNVVLANGTYKLTDAITTITGSISISGGGLGSTVLMQYTASSNTFSVNTTESVIFKDFQIYYSSIGTGTATGIYFTGDSSYSSVTGVYITRAWYGIHIYRASYWIIANSNFHTNQKAGIYVQNVTGTDAGDTLISGCFIVGNATTNNSSCIRYSSGSGLRIQGNKLLYAYRPIEMISDGGGLGSWLIDGNNIDPGCVGSDYGIYITDNGYAVGNGVISNNNELQGGIYINGTNYEKCYAITISGNSIFPQADYNTNEASIKVTKSRWITITGNAMRKFSTYPTYGIYADSEAFTDVFVSGNYGFGYASGYTVAGNAWGYAHNGTRQPIAKSSGGTWTVIGSAMSQATVVDDGASYLYSDAQVLIQGSTTSTKMVALGLNTSDNTGWIQAMNHGILAYPLVLNPSGGIVSVGAHIGQAKLYVDAINAGAGNESGLYLATGGIDRSWFMIDDIGTTPFTELNSYNNLQFKHNGSSIMTMGSTGLSVTGDIAASGDISASGTCCDFVLEPGYSLPSIEEVEDHIAIYQKLPGLEKPDGLSLKDLMVKTEEQALYIVELNNRLKDLESRLAN